MPIKKCYFLQLFVDVDIIVVGLILFGWQFAIHRRT